MYSPLNEDYMFEEMKTRVARIHPRLNPQLGKDRADDALPNRRWWRKGLRLAG